MSEEKTWDIDSKFLCCERIHKDIFEKGERRGAIQELEHLKKCLDNQGYVHFGGLYKWLEKRLKELHSAPCGIQAEHKGGKA